MTNIYRFEMNYTAPDFRGGRNYETVIAAKDTEDAKNQARSMFSSLYNQLGCLKAQASLLTGGRDRKMVLALKPGYGLAHF